MDEGFRQLVTDIFSAEHTPPAALLVYLSGLGREQMAVLAEVWQAASPKRRREVIGQLVKIARENVEYNFQPMFRFGLGSPDPAIRLNSILGLAEAEDPALIAPFAAILKSDPSEDVRVGAAALLGELGILAETGKLRSGHGQIIYGSLLGAVESPAETSLVRARALAAIAAFNTPRVAALIEEARHSGEYEMEQAALAAMGLTCDPKWLPEIVSAFASDDEAERVTAAGAAGEMSREEAVPGLIRLAGDEVEAVRLAAVAALGEIGGEVAKKFLESRLANASKRERDAITAALEQIHIFEFGAPTRRT